MQKYKKEDHESLPHLFLKWPACSMVWWCIFFPRGMHTQLSHNIQYILVFKWRYRAATIQLLDWIITTVVL